MNLNFIQKMCFRNIFNKFYFININFSQFLSHFQLYGIFHLLLPFVTPLHWPNYIVKVHACSIDNGLTIAAIKSGILHTAKTEHQSNLKFISETTRRLQIKF